MDNISTSLLCDIFTKIYELINKLEYRNILEEYTSNTIYIPVKKDKDLEKYYPMKTGTGIIEDLIEIISICEKTRPSLKKNETISNLVDMCYDAKKYLSKEYPKKKRFGNKNNLINEDRKVLIDDLEACIEDLIDRVKDTKVILNLEPKQNLDVDKKSLKILDKSAKADLEEGLTLLQLGHTTAAYMILIRVAEFFVLQYYKKITGIMPKDSDRAWGSMLASLHIDYKSKLDKNFANLLHYLKDRRNEAQHPGKRFNEKDCNKLITYLTEYVDYFAKQKL